MNPLPTFAPDGSFGILAELLGRPLAELLAEVLAAASRGSGCDGAPSPAPGAGVARATGSDWTLADAQRVRSAAELARFVTPTEDEAPRDRARSPSASAS